MNSLFAFCCWEISVEVALLMMMMTLHQHRSPRLFEIDFPSGVRGGVHLWGMPCMMWQEYTMKKIAVQIPTIIYGGFLDIAFHSAVVRTLLVKLYSSGSLISFSRSSCLIVTQYHLYLFKCSVCNLSQQCTHFGGCMTNSMTFSESVTHCMITSQ